MTRLSTTDLARRCGVSQGTVDRALHDRPGIAPATRGRILREAARRGYVPHQAARALITGRQQLLGLILFGLDNHFTARLIRSIETAARAAGSDLLVAFSNRDPDLERRYFRRFLERRVDGVMVFPVTTNSEELELAAKQQLPVVALFNRLPGRAVNCLALNEAGAMTALARRLGAARVAFVTYPVAPGLNADALVRRRAAFLAAAPQAAVFTTDQLPATWDGFDVVVCHNDRLARAVAHARVTGFDAADDDPPLAATFAVPYQAIARRAVELIQTKQFGINQEFNATPIWKEL